MITVIIAGGSGTRLWPLSTQNYPKHLLRLTNDRTSLQNTYDRAKKVSKKIYIVTEASHSEHIFEQLPAVTEQEVIIEPGRRGTASCIVAAIDRIIKYESVDEPIVIMHADHHIRDVDNFVNTVKFAGKVSDKQKRIVLLGVEPAYPATGFGYIKKSSKASDDADRAFVYKVDSFKEKPDYDTANDYVQSGNYLWNMGYFVASAKVYIEKMKDYASDLFKSFEDLKAAKDPESYKKTYLNFKNIAIDYALLEKMPDLLVVPGSFDWVDIGSFAQLHEVSDLDKNDNYFRGDNIEVEDVENSYVRNECEQPVAVIGLDNVVVVNTANGVLVVRKDLSQKVGDIAKRIYGKQ